MTEDPIADRTVPGDMLRPFPPAADVFVADQQALVRHLHPLVSIDLSAVNPAWSGWAHLLSPLEAEGLVGEHSPAFHDAYSRTNVIILRLEGDRYRFLGDFRYFLLEQDRAAVPADMRDIYDRLETQYADAEASYRRAADAYARNGRLYWLDDSGAIAPGHADNPQDLIGEVGGTPGFGNWTVDFAMPFEPATPPGEPEPDAVWPLSPAGRRFEFVAETSGYPYRSEGADSILLFYEPVERLVLLTFDWT